MTDEEDFFEYIRQFQESGNLERFQKQLMARWKSDPVSMWRLMIKYNQQCELLLNEKLDTYGIKGSTIYNKLLTEALELENEAINKDFQRYCQLGDHSSQVALIISSCSSTISVQDIRGSDLSPDNLYQVLVQYREMVEIHKRIIPTLAAVSAIISGSEKPEDVIVLEHWDKLRDLFEAYKPGAGAFFVWSEDARHIRNSISHGTRYPDMEQETIRFVDKAWVKVYTFNEYMELFNQGVYWIMGVCHAILLSRNIAFKKMIEMVQ